MVAIRPSWHAPTFRFGDIEFDRATAFAFAVAGNALVFLMLSLPYSSDGSFASFVPDEPDFDVVDVVEVRQPDPASVPDLPVPPEHVQPTPVIAPIIEKPTSQIIEVALTPPSPPSESAVATLSQQPQISAPPGPQERSAGVAYGFSPAPDYPSIALRRGWEGTVVLLVRVGRNGQVLEVRIDESSGRNPLDQAAQRQVAAHWRFEPALREGRPVEAWVRVPVEFSLRRR